METSVDVEEKDIDAANIWDSEQEEPEGLTPTVGSLPEGVQAVSSVLTWFYEVSRQLRGRFEHSNDGSEANWA